MGTSYSDRIRAARVYEVARETPLDLAPGLSQRLGNTVLLKREDLQPVFSFKLRGAYNRIVRLTDAEKARGIVAASAGNHAQGVGLSAQRLGLKATIVMPVTTPTIKVQSVRAYGVRVVLHGDTYDEAYSHAEALAAKSDQRFIHPYDDPDVIAGQGTIALEIARQHPDRFDAIFVPVGGGGLIAGVAAFLKPLRPDTKIIGVEPDDAACMHAALKAGKRVVLDQVGIFADGVAVRQIGKEPFELAKRYVDEVLTVSTDEICAAIKDIFDDTRSLAEPAGALAIAGLKNYVRRTGVRGQRLIAINSGANINFDRLRHVAERAELGERREAVFAVTIPERPGSFRTFCQAIGKRGITEFNYRYASSSEAHIFVGVQLSEGEDEKHALIDQLRSRDYPVVDMSDNETAKLHVRHMVGGRSATAGDELLFRFEFPERPGALLKFLNAIGQNWNISLFHYRNHGAAYGRVLVGMQVPQEDHAKLKVSLEKLGYSYWEESGNPVYQLFLGSPQEERQTQKRTLASP